MPAAGPDRSVPARRAVVFGKTKKRPQIAQGTSRYSDLPLSVPLLSQLPRDLAAAFRPRPGGHAQRFRPARRAAQSPRVARLAGVGVRGPGLALEADPPDDLDLGGLPAGLASAARRGRPRGADRSGGSPTLESRPCARLDAEEIRDAHPRGQRRARLAENRRGPAEASTQDRRSAEDADGPRRPRRLPDRVRRPRRQRLDPAPRHHDHERPGPPSAQRQVDARSRGELRRPPRTSHARVCRRTRSRDAGPGSLAAQGGLPSRQRSSRP